MRLFDLFEAELDPTGWGATPMGTNVAYEGLRVRMKPSVFLWMAHQLDPSSVNPEVEKHMAGGGKIANPFLQVAIPPEWEDGNFTKHAKVVGHEGRNRMTNWIKLKGDEPVEVQIFPRGGMRRHHITDDMIKHMASGMFNEDGDFTRGPLFDVSSALEESVEDNPNFARWFAGSKVVDARGKPLVVYHGTSGDFPAFSKKKVRPNFNSPQKHLGFFFTDDPKYAGQYAGRGFDNEDANIIPVYLSLKNPAHAPISLIDEIEDKWSQTRAKQFVEKLKSQGHDGIIFSGTAKIGNINEYVAFDPKQIKSAISSKFGDNPNIVDEGWKDWVAGAAMAGAALGAHGKTHHAPKHATHTKPAVTQKAQANPNVVGSAIKVDPTYKEPTVAPRVKPQVQAQVPVKGQDAKSPAFAQKLKTVAADLQVHPDDLLKVMHFETKGTLDPAITNRIGATGLIQFMPDTAKSLGTTVDALRKMSAVQQLDYVHKYFKSKIKPGFKASDIYLATLLPVALRLPDHTVIAQKGNKTLVPHTEFSKNRMFNQNPAFAKPGKSHYTVGDIRDAIDKRAAPTISTLASSK